MEAVRYKLPVDVYPRFEFFRSRLSCIVPRLKRFVDAGNFATCISQGNETLQDIIQSTSLLEEDVTVSVIESGAKLPADFVSELQVKHLMSGIEHETVQESVVLEGMKSSTKFHPHFLVYLMTSPSVETVMHIFKNLPANNHQQQNVIIYDVATKTNFSIVDLLEAMDTEQSVKLYTQNRNIGEQVQYLLEDRVVEILENVVNFNQNFAPKTVTLKEKDLLEQCNNEVTKSLRCKFVMDDLDPEKVRSSDTNGSDTIDIDCLPRDISQLDIGAEDVMKMSQEQDEQFFLNLLDYLTKKTRCYVCEYLSKKYKVRAAIVNEFLNEGFFDYSRKYREDWQSMPFKPKWSSVKRSNQDFSKIILSYIGSQQKFFTEVEDYIKKLLKLLMGFDKLNFEVFGLLRKAQVPVLTYVPVYPKMSPDMQSQLLSLEPDVVGCGTIYGTLTIHLRGIASEQLNENIKEIITRYNYYHGYKVQTLRHRNHHLLEEPEVEEIKCGKGIRATHTPEAMSRYNRADKSPKEHRTGTLGCFIVLRKETSEDEIEIEPSKGEISSTEGMEDLFGITCAHCVTDCHPEIEVMHNDVFQTLGHTEVHLYDGQRIDIAAVRIIAERRSTCNVQICFRNWSLYDEKAHDAHKVASVVFKEGAATGTTQGIVISNDYKPNVKADFRDDVINEANAEGDNFDSDYNILIDVKADYHESAMDGTRQEKKFSESGDSGSVVYFMEMDRVIVMSLLEGNMVLNDLIEEDLEWTYSSHLKKCLDMLCNKTGYRLEIPWSTALPTPTIF